MTPTKILNFSVSANLLCGGGMMACASSEGEDQASSKTASAKAAVKLGRAKAAAAAGNSPAMFCTSS